MKTCTKCGNKKETDVPQDRCLASYKCEKCKEIISVPKESKDCCVICEYSDKRCPVAKPIEDNPCDCCK